jgi:hypothetical protein
MQREAIDSYSRKQALADGDLVAAPDELAHNAGFKVPVAITRAVWADCVQWDGPGEDTNGRWWDLLWMASLAIRGSRDRSRATVRLVRTPVGRCDLGPQEVALTMAIGPGDEGEPVITIKQPNED